jgi:hypothetical protein
MVTGYSLPAFSRFPMSKQRYANNGLFSPMSLPWKPIFNANKKKLQEKHIGSITQRPLITNVHPHTAVLIFQVFRCKFLLHSVRLFDSIDGKLFVIQRK